MERAMEKQPLKTTHQWLIALMAALSLTAGGCSDLLNEPDKHTTSTAIHGIEPGASSLDELKTEGILYTGEVLLQKEHITEAGGGGKSTNWFSRVDFFAEPTKKIPSIAFRTEGKKAFDGVKSTSAGANSFSIAVMKVDDSAVTTIQRKVMSGGTADKAEKDKLGKDIMKVLTLGINTGSQTPFYGTGESPVGDDAWDGDQSWPAGGLTSLGQVIVQNTADLKVLAEDKKLGGLYMPGDAADDKSQFASLQNIDTTKGYDIAWLPDANLERAKPLKTEMLIVIEVIEAGKMIARWSRIVPDNGHYTISPALFVKTSPANPHISSPLLPEGKEHVPCTVKLKRRYAFFTEKGLWITTLSEMGRGFIGHPKPAPPKP